MRSFLVLLVAAAWACDSSKPDSAAHQQSAPPNSVVVAPPDSSTVAQKPEAMVPLPVDTGPVVGSAAEGSSPELDEWISQFAKGVDTTVTLGDWLADHPADAVSRTRPTGMHDEPFCRSAAAPITGGARVWRRSAVFVIPDPPPDQPLPDATALPERLCRLRALWLESRDTDSLRAERAAAALRGQFSRALGPARPGVLMTGPSMGRWRGAASWVSGPRVVVVGAYPGTSYMDATDTVPVVLPPIVAAVSYVIGNGLDTSVSALIDKIEYPKVGPEALVAMARADSAIGWSGMSGLVPLRRLFANHLDSAHFDRSGRRLPDASVDSVLVHALAAMRDTATLPPPQRSAAFLAADIAIQVHARWLDYQGKDTVFRQELERVGAPYQYDQLGAVWIYLRPWLWRAYQLDSLGRAGKSAFAELLRGGWTTAIACGGGSDMTAEVITRGERALDAGLSDPMVRLYVAQAYADVFSLSPGGVGESASDSARALAAKSEMGRRRAIDHYRKALAAVRDPGLRRTIWDNSVRLMLRRPIETRYFCEYD